MSGHADPPEATNLKGLSKHFNTMTLRGRANVAIATYTFCGLMGMYFYLKPKKSPAA